MAAPIAFEDYRRLTNRLFEAPLRSGAWRDFLGDLAAVTGGGTFTHIIAKDTRRNLHLGDLTHGYDPDWGPPYYQHYHAINPWLLSAQEHPVGRAIYSYEMCPDPVFERSEFYADWIRPQEDAIAGGSIAIARTPTQVFKLGACIRRRDREAVEDRFVAILGILAEPLAHAWALSRRVVASQQLIGENPETDAGEVAVALVDRAGQLRFADASAEGELASGARMQLTMSGRVRFADRSVDAQLERIVAALRRGGSAWWRGTCGGAELSMTAMPDGVRGDGLSALIVGAGAPCVQIVLSRSDAPEVVGRLAARLGLTRAEAAVAMALAEGMTPREIAEARGASLNTVRNQIKAALHVCGARRQAELVSLVLRSRE
jgi:DNA-binding CsgD family transcriptional regulator